MSIAAFTRVAAGDCPICGEPLYCKCEAIDLSYGSIDYDVWASVRYCRECGGKLLIPGDAKIAYRKYRKITDQALNAEPEPVKKTATAEREKVHAFVPNAAKNTQSPDTADQEPKQEIQAKENPEQQDEKANNEAKFAPKKSGGVLGAIKNFVTGRNQKASDDAEETEESEKIEQNLDEKQQEKPENESEFSNHNAQTEPAVKKAMPQNQETQEKMKPPAQTGNKANAMPQQVPVQNRQPNSQFLPKQAFPPIGRSAPFQMKGNKHIIPATKGRNTMADLQVSESAQQTLDNMMEMLEKQHPEVKSARSQQPKLQHPTQQQKPEMQKNAAGVPKAKLAPQVQQGMKQAVKTQPPKPAQNRQEVPVQQQKPSVGQQPKPAQAANKPNQAPQSAGQVQRQQPKPLLQGQPKNANMPDGKNKNMVQAPSGKPVTQAPQAQAQTPRKQAEPAEKQPTEAQPQVPQKPKEGMQPGMQQKANGQPETKKTMESSQKPVSGAMTPDSSKAAKPNPENEAQKTVQKPEDNHQTQTENRAEKQEPKERNVDEHGVKAEHTQTKETASTDKKQEEKSAVQETRKPEENGEKNSHEPPPKKEDKEKKKKTAENERLKKLSAKLPTWLITLFPSLENLGEEPPLSKDAEERKLKQQTKDDQNGPHVRAILNDMLFDTDKSTMFLKQKGAYGFDRPCIHYNYRTENGNFFRCTVKMNKKENPEIRILDVEMDVKPMLKDNPELYRKFFPDSIKDA